MGKWVAGIASLLFCGCAVTKLHFSKPKRLYTLIVFANDVNEAEAWAVIDEAKIKLRKESNIILDTEWACIQKEITERGAQEFLMQLKLEAYQHELLDHREYNSIVFMLPSSFRLIKGLTEGVGCAFSMPPCASFVRLRSIGNQSVNTFMHEILHQAGSGHALPFVGTATVL